MSVFKEFLLFLKNPQEIETQVPLTVKAKIIYFLKSLPVYFFLLFISAFFIGIAQIGLKLLNIDEPVNSADPKEIIDRYGIILSILEVAILVPFMEEAMFRLPLSFKKAHIAIAIPIIAFFAGITAIDDMLMLLVLTLFIITVVLLLIVVKQEQLNAYKTKYFKTILWISIIGFTALHLGNFEEMHTPALPLYFLLYTSVLALAIMLSFLRIRLGYFYAVLLHCFHNSWVLLLSLFTNT